MKQIYILGNSQTMTHSLRDYFYLYSLSKTECEPYSNFYQKFDDPREYTLSERP